MRLIRCFASATLALCLAAPLRAAEVDANIPGDTEVVLSVNLEQLLNSPLGKKYLRTSVEEAIKSNPQGQELFKFLELDPLKDITRVTVALSSVAADSGFVIVKGKFNRAKIAELAEKVAVEQKDKLKIHKDGGTTVYEIAGEPKPMFLMVAGDSTLLLGTDREQVASSEKRGKPKKELVALIEKADGKQSAWLAALPGVASAAPVTDDAQKQVLEKLEGILGVLKVQTSARLELTLISQNAQTALATNKMIIDFVNVAKLFGPDAVKEKPELAPLLEVLNSIRTAAKGKTVTVTAEVSAAQIDKAIKLVGADK